MFDVIIPVRDRHDLLTRAVDSVLSGNGACVRTLILVDDGSQPELPLMQSQDVLVVQLRNARSLGFLSAVEAGLERTTEDRVLVLNSDAELTPGLLEDVLHSDAPWDLLGFLGTNAAEYSFPGRARGIVDRMLIRHPRARAVDHGGIERSLEEALLSREGDLTVHTRRIHGFCFAFRASRIASIGGLRGSTLSSGRGLETDLSLRVIDAGGTVSVFLGAVLPHVGGASTPTPARMLATLIASFRLRRRYGHRRIRWAKLPPVDVCRLAEQLADA